MTLQELLQEDACIRCRTQEEADRLMIELEKLGYSWARFYQIPSLSDDSKWEKYREDTEYLVDVSLRWIFYSDARCEKSGIWREVDFSDIDFPENSPRACGKDFADISSVSPEDVHRAKKIANLTLSSVEEYFQDHGIAYIDCTDRIECEVSDDPILGSFGAYWRPNYPGWEKGRLTGWGVALDADDSADLPVFSCGKEIIDRLESCRKERKEILAGKPHIFNRDIAKQEASYWEPCHRRRAKGINLLADIEEYLQTHGIPYTGSLAKMELNVSGHPVFGNFDVTCSESATLVCFGRAVQNEKGCAIFSVYNDSRDVIARLEKYRKEREAKQAKQPTQARHFMHCYIYELIELRKRLDPSSALYVDPAELHKTVAAYGGHAALWDAIADYAESNWRDDLDVDANVNHAISIILRDPVMGKIRQEESAQKKREAAIARKAQKEAEKAETEGEFAPPEYCLAFLERTNGLDPIVKYAVRKPDADGEEKCRVALLQDVFGHCDEFDLSWTGKIAGPNAHGKLGDNGKWSVNYCAGRCWTTDTYDAFTNNAVWVQGFVSWLTANADELLQKGMGK